MKKERSLKGSSVNCVFAEKVKLITFIRLRFKNKKQSPPDLMITVWKSNQV